MSKVKTDKTKKKVTVEEAYCLLQSPIISEKTTGLSEQGQIVFMVTPEATKPKVKKAVESLFSVKVKTVNMLNQQGKRKRFRGQWGRRKNYKKAIITLEKGQNLELLTGAKG